MACLDYHQKLLQVALFTLLFSLHRLPKICGDRRVDDCHDALRSGGLVQQCIKAVQLKWRLTSFSSSVDSCCAVYEALNCAQNRSCHICPSVDLSDWAQFRIRSLDALGQTLCKDTPYAELKKQCKVVGEVAPLKWHCANEPKDKPKGNHTASAIILALATIAIIILVAVLWLVIDLTVFKEDSDSNLNKSGSSNTVPSLQSSNPKLPSVKTDRI